MYLFIDDLQQLHVRDTVKMISLKVDYLLQQVVGFGTMEQHVGGDTSSGVWVDSRGHAKMHPLLLRLWIFARLTLALPPSSCLMRPLILCPRHQAPKLTLNIHRYNIIKVLTMYSCQNCNQSNEKYICLVTFLGLGLNSFSCLITIW